MDTLEHFTTRHIPDSIGPQAVMKLHTDEEGRFIIDIEDNQFEAGCGIYLDKDARKELIAILLKTL